MATANNAPASPLATTEINASPTAPLASAPPAPAPAGPAPAAQQGASPMPLAASPDPDIPNETVEQTRGVGVEGETNVWEARYSMKNFLGRFTFWGLAAVAWIALAIYCWGYNHPNLGVLAIVGGIALGLVWIGLGYRVVLARYGHFYRLTNRRVFVSTGLFSRRRDQMELLRVQDVYTKQSLAQRWLGVGTVVVVSTEPHFPILYLTGVDEPKYVMDLVWHHARAERDRRSVKVDQI